MKKILMIMTVLSAAFGLYAADTNALGLTPAADVAVVTFSAMAQVDVTQTAQALAKMPVMRPAFGYLENSAVTTCAHDKKRKIDWQSLSPLDLKARWNFRLRYKDRVAETMDVVGLIEYTKELNGSNYYFYSVPLENKGNLIRFTADGAYLRRLKFQVFSFVFVDVDLDPEIHYLHFPMKAGDEWEESAMGTVELLGFIKIRRKTSTKFKVTKEIDVLINGAPEHVYVITSDIDRGDGKMFHEEDWFGEGTGLMYSDTEAYTLELESFVPGNKAKQEAKQ